MTLYPITLETLIIIGTVFRGQVRKLYNPQLFNPVTGEMEDIEAENGALGISLGSYGCEAVELARK
jgi:hypothetical protein